MRAMITTSINMSPGTRDAVASLARRLKITQRQLIIDLLAKLMRDVNRRLGGFTGVRYQPALKEGKWHPFCICFKKEEYEFYTDLRKICKLTVSYLVAIAVKEYMVEILTRNCKSVYNYIFPRDCALSLRIIDRVICWQYYWGEPPPIARSHPPEKWIRQTGALRHC
jgi:hypothetical protein